MLARAGRGQLGGKDQVLVGARDEFVRRH